MAYNVTVIYKKGSELFIADTLSRDCQIEEGIRDEAPLKICIIVPMSVERIQYRHNEKQKKTRNYVR